MTEGSRELIPETRGSKTPNIYSLVLVAVVVSHATATFLLTVNCDETSSQTYTHTYTHARTHTHTHTDIHVHTGTHGQTPTDRQRCYTDCNPGPTIAIPRFGTEDFPIL